MDLFEYVREKNLEKEAPLASRLRPTTLEEVVGQQHIIGKDKLLYRAIKADKLSSIIFYGPPGTGKTTLAKVIAHTKMCIRDRVSPELLPPKDGKIAQKTEDLVGPYELHDFFLYYFLRFGYAPSKIYRIAKYSFAGEYDDETIYKWLRTFCWRFFAQQFKRSCLPDGPKVGTVALSPRGDWRMPSDACVASWMRDLEQVVR